MLNDDPQLNVFGVDWSGGAKNTNYFQSAFDGKMVGLIIANFIKKLMKEYNISPSSISIVGHSVGGQIPAFIGKEFTSPKIRHILCKDKKKFRCNEKSVKTKTFSQQITGLKKFRCNV